jgi:hypothetical protein
VEDIWIKSLRCDGLSGNERPVETISQRELNDRSSPDETTQALLTQKDNLPQIIINGLDQPIQLNPRHSIIHLVEKLTIACSLDDQLKSGGGKGGLLHEDMTFNSDSTLIFAELS